MRRHAAALATAVWLVACSSTPATFALIGASVDPTYKCPGGANNAAYDLHATIDARNNTSRPVTVESITAEMTLTAGPHVRPDRVHELGIDAAHQQDLWPRVGVVDGARYNVRRRERVRVVPVLRLHLPKPQLFARRFRPVGPERDGLLLPLGAEL